MANEIIDTKVIEDLISYAKELYEFYYNDKNNKMGSSFKIKGFSEDDGKAYNHVMSQITLIISEINKFYDEYIAKISSNTNYTFEKQLKLGAWRQLKVNVFNEFAKLEEINVISDLDEAIAEKVADIRKLWQLDEIIESNWKDFIGADNDEAYARLIKENEKIQGKVDQLLIKKQIAEYYGYIPADDEQIKLILQANPTLNKVFLLKESYNEQIKL